MMKMNHTEAEAVHAARDRLQAAPQGDKGAIVDELARTLQCSRATAYRKLTAAGLATGRQRRADAGRTAMTLPELRLVSGVLFHSRRENDKQLLSVEDALDMLQASGQLQCRLSPGRVGALLRQHHLHPEQLAQPEPAQEMRSLHPNHVWGIDGSICVLYRMKSGHLASMERDEFYRNKPANVAAVLNDLALRLTVADHYSGAFKPRYYMGGESAANIVDMWLYAVCKQPLSPMHGVPYYLMMDRGSGNRSALFTNLLKRMDVKPIVNGKGAPRSKGFVEKPNDLIERHFEGWFRFFKPEELTLENINHYAELWAAKFCSSRKHSRHGKPRYSSWMEITEPQLRVPTFSDLRELATTEPEARRVDNFRCISFVVKGFGKQDYDLRTVPGALVGSKVLVVVNVYRAPAVDVGCADPATGEMVWQTVEPVQRNEGGFREDAAVWGQDMRRAAHTVADEERNRITREAYRGAAGAPLPTLEEAKAARKRHEQAYAGVVDPLAYLQSTPVPAYLPRRGTPLQTPAPREVQPVVLGLVDAAKRLRVLLGSDYSAQVYGWLAARYPNGVPEERLEALAAELRPATGAAPQRAAGGAA